jgi:phosphoglycolate phosphatase-like HAD superfamily hydrolase
MNLVVFDVDGTLTDTNEIDGICFTRALQLEFGTPEISLDWQRYSHSTDAGISTEILTESLGRPPSITDLERAKSRFLTLLKEAHERNPNDFNEIPGARNILGQLRSHVDWKIAIATGCWMESAILKLQNAGIPADFPFASCDKLISRDEIISDAITRAKLDYDCRDFSSVVYVGDGIWDVNAARALGIGFIGISPNGKRSRLEKAGARFILNSFQPASAFLKILREWNDYACFN